jgi:hypothetical protein
MNLHADPASEEYYIIKVSYIVYILQSFTVSILKAKWHLTALALKVESIMLFETFAIRFPCVRCSPHNRIS